MLHQRHRVHRVYNTLTIIDLSSREVQQKVDGIYKKLCTKSSELRRYEKQKYRDDIKETK